MTLSRQLAGLIGPTLIVLSVSEALNLPIWSQAIAPVTYLNGLILFVAGLAVVRFHNRWARDWTVVITLLGWTVLAAGLYRMFFPTAPQADAGALTYTMIGCLCLIGCFLTYKAYR